MATTAQPPAATLGRAADFVRPDFHQVNLDIEQYLKQERGMKLDSGKYECYLPTFFLCAAATPRRSLRSRR